MVQLIFLSFGILFLAGCKYKFVCFDMTQTGGVGENLVHTCLLNSTSIHADLAKRLLKHYPKLMNDIYISDEYFGKFILYRQNVCVAETRKLSRQLQFALIDVWSNLWCFLFVIILKYMNAFQ